MVLLIVVVMTAQADTPADKVFLSQVARDTWRYFEECKDSATGLVWDSASENRSTKGVYTSPTNVGMDICCTVAANDLGIIDRKAAIQRISGIFETLDKLEKDKGLFYNFYRVDSLRPTNKFVSSIDNAWLSVALMVARQAYPDELSGTASRLLKSQNYGVFYDKGNGLLWWGYNKEKTDTKYGHYDMFCSESRAAYVVAIGKGDITAQSWFRMTRAPKVDGKGYNSGEIRSYRGVKVRESYFVYNGKPIVPSWGGSMFEFLMPALFFDEAGLAPKSLGENARRAVDAQIAYAKQAGLCVWGMSPCAKPDGNYAACGVTEIGAGGYPPEVITPHAAFLALEVRPEEAIGNLNEMAKRYKIRGRYGFFDSVDPKSGSVCDRYLVLDQGMILIAIDNYLHNGAIRRRVMQDPLMKRIPALLAEERFY